MGKHTDSTDSKILRRIQARKRGWVFTPDSFTDLGTRRAVDLALMRHRDSGLIRQLARGCTITRKPIPSSVLCNPRRMISQAHWQAVTPPGEPE